MCELLFSMICDSKVIIYIMFVLLSYIIIDYIYCTVIGTKPHVFLWLLQRSTSEMPMHLPCITVEIHNIQNKKLNIKTSFR